MRLLHAVASTRFETEARENSEMAYWRGRSVFFCRRGSVVAIFNLTFTRDIANELGDNVTNNLVVAVKSGNLGELAVDPASLNITKIGK